MPLACYCKPALPWNRLIKSWNRLISLVPRHNAGLLIETGSSFVGRLECCSAGSDISLLILLSLLTVSLCPARQV